MLFCSSTQIVQREEKMQHNPINKIAGALFLFLLVGGCNSNKSLAPFQPQINNAPDNFQFQATNVKNTTVTLNYTWQNSGTSANVNQACAITAGTATLVILDANAVEVYNKDLTANGTFQTSTGATGNWNIRVILTNVGGTLNFRVQKP
jgi:hypothetical protein